MQTTEQIAEHPVKTIRKARNMTQEALAQLAEVSRPTIVKIEQGAHITHTESLRAIARALGAPWQELCGPGQAVVARSREELAEITAGHPIVTAHSRDAEDILAALGKVYGRDSADPEDRAWLGGLVRSWLDGIKEQSA